MALRWVLCLFGLFFFFFFSPFRKLLFNQNTPLNQPNVGCSSAEKQNGLDWMIPFQSPPWAGPPATAPVCPQSHPAWPWTTDRSCFCHSNSPWHICFHRRFPLLLPFTPLGLEWPNCLFIPGYSPGLTCLPDSTQSLPWKPWEPPEEPGALGDAAGPEHLGAASRNSHIPSHPCKATAGTGEQSSAASHTRGESSPCLSCFKSSFSSARVRIEAQEREFHVWTQMFIHSYFYYSECCSTSS